MWRLIMGREIHEKFIAKNGDLAISIEGDYTIIVDRDLNKFKYNSWDYDVSVNNKNGRISVYVRKSNTT